MGLLAPVFAAEARWQAEALGDETTRAAAAAQLDADIASAPVVVYTYGLSPFSSEAIALLDAEGVTYKNIPLGQEWFLLGAQASAVRAELLDRHGFSSLPHVFVGGRSVGGLYSGPTADAPGLVALREDGRLAKMLTKSE